MGATIVTFVFIIVYVWYGVISKGPETLYGPSSYPVYKASSGLDEEGVFSLVTVAVFAPFLVASVISTVRLWSSDD